jgi:hypothetical protein
MRPFLSYGWPTLSSEVDRYGHQFAAVDAAPSGPKKSLAAIDIGVVSRSITIDLFFGEITVWGSWQLRDDDRKSLIEERDQGSLVTDEACPPDP